MALVELTVDPQGIATLTLNDPDVRNAMSNPMAAAFRDRIAELKRRPGLRAVVLTGAGSCFAAGGDLKMLKEKAAVDAETNAAEMMEFYRSFLGMLELPVPLIAAINGHAIGAGLCIALACEARIIAADAKLGLNFTRIGLHPGMGATFFLPRLAGPAVASDLLVSGRIFSAPQALEMGLVNKVVDRPMELRCARELAQEYAASGPSATAALLSTLRPDSEQLERALQREAAAQGADYTSEEFREGIAAALEKRPPNFGST